MKKFVIIIISVIIIAAVAGFAIYKGVNSKKENSDNNNSKSSITKEMAYEGVSNYTHSNYDWSIAKDDSSTMYLEIGEETDTEYKIIFRSYTGAFVYFYVNKETGNTRMVEYVPNLNIENEAGTFNLNDYLNK